MFLLRLILGFVGLVVLIFSVIAGGTLAYTSGLTVGLRRPQRRRRCRHSQT